MFQSQIINHVMNKTVSSGDTSYQSQYELLKHLVESEEENTTFLPEEITPLEHLEHNDIYSLWSLISEEINELTALVEEVSQTVSTKISKSGRVDVPSLSENVHLLRLPELPFINYNGMFASLSNDWKINNPEVQMKALNMIISLIPQVPVGLVMAILNGDYKLDQDKSTEKYAAFYVTLDTNK